MKKWQRSYDFSLDISEEDALHLLDCVKKYNELSKTYMDHMFKLKEDHKDDLDVCKVIDRLQNGGVNERRALATCIFGGRKKSEDVFLRVKSYKKALALINSGEAKTYEDLSKSLGKKSGLRLKTNSLFKEPKKEGQRKDRTGLLKEDQAKKIKNMLDADLGIVSALNLCKRGLLPIPEFVANVEKINKDVLYGIIAQAGTRFQSFLKSDDSTQQNYLNLKEILKSYRLEYNLDEFKEQEASYQQWLSRMKSLDSFALTHRFLQGWAKRWRKQFLAGKDLSWTLGEEATKICKEYQHLFVDNDFIYLFGKEDLLKLKVEERKQNAQFTLPDVINSPIYPQLGNNSQGFGLEQVDNDIYLIIQSCFVDRPNIRAKIVPHKKTSVWSLEQEANPVDANPVDAKPSKKKNPQIDKDKIPYKLILRRAADRYEKQIEISECRLQHRFCSGKANFHVVFSLKGEANDTLDKVSTLFLTATQKPVSEWSKNNLPKQMRVAFVDIGLNPPLSMSIYDYNQEDNSGENPVYAGADQQIPFGSANLVREDQIGNVYNQNLKRRIQELNDKIFFASSCVSFYKNISSLEGATVELVGGRQVMCRRFDEEKIKDLYSVPVKSLRELGLDHFFGLPEDLDQQNVESAIFYIENHIHHNNLTRESFLSFRCKVWDYIHEKILPEFSVIQNGRHFQFNKQFCSEAYSWMFLIHSMIRLKKSLSYSHSEPLKKGEPATFVFKNLQNYFNNFSKNVLKTVASKLRDYCTTHNVSLCVVEDLEKFRTSSLNSKDKNRLLSIWSHRNVVQRFEEVLTEVGITIISNDARHSSQLDPVTMDWAYRDEQDKSKLWVKRDGEIDYINADISSTQVQAKRFFSRYADIVYMKTLLKKDDNGALRKLVVSDTSTRIQSYLLRIIHSKYAILEQDKLVPINQEEYNQIAGLKTSGVEEIYRHGESWVNLITHKALQKEIGASANVQSKSP